jgi:uncharacterized phage protein
MEGTRQNLQQEKEVGMEGYCCSGVSYEMNCPACRGTGYDPLDGGQCDRCNGTGVIER